METCKNCGSLHINGSNFCTRKCRIDWIEGHKKKGAKSLRRKKADLILNNWAIKGEWK